MSDDWDFYALLVESEPASIYLNIGLAQNAPNESQPNLAYVRVPMRYPRPEGLSSSEEFEALCAVEDALSEVCAGNVEATYAGRSTSDGNRDFYFYTTDPAAFADHVGAAMAGHPDYEFKIVSRPDPAWDVYFKFLFPSPDDLQRILNRRVTDSLADHGDNLSEPRSVDHLAYLPNTTAAESLRDYLCEQDFSMEEPRVEGGTVALNFKRFDRPDSIDDVVIPIARRVRELRGDYDGWGCEVVN